MGINFLTSRNVQEANSEKKGDQPGLFNNRLKQIPKQNGGPARELLSQ
jgi:hypothetical protein